MAGRVSDERGRVRRRKHDPFFRTDNRIHDNYGAAMGPGAIAVYWSLCRRGNETSWAAVSIGRIAADIGCSRSTVKRGIERLERLGLITVEEVVTPHGDHGSNDYIIEEPGDGPPAGWKDGPRPERHVQILAPSGGGSTTDQGDERTPEGVGSNRTHPGSNRTDGRFTLNRGRFYLNHIEEEPLEEEHSQEEDAQTPGNTRIRELVAAYVRAREAGYSDAELAELEEREDNPPGVPVFPWSEWVGVRNDRRVRHALAAEKRRIGATW